jgi:hypothetical protein
MMAAVVLNFLLERPPAMNVITEDDSQADGGKK